ncbi:4Fe-4S binding protein [Flagellimonas zhangzhouensis]|uniref:Pyruvate-ferredoxin/flavodoxin oxidoreductase n=1 Tax=Flagellimonas zhangzhouensis TaxID=1073328 RepID=A0A1H2RLE2_9FLAO|nr:4Fe-4S binding protein [Allomuricauda zhangzhouensis]SDQ64666.1 pyruvate-ferredoxin/flavodoxin oxidoreductase [Allomuricauda zhangzhouensis]SDW19584.1 pyruvate-ferredoxin/flavodoxin oxidoreductase [Allomuricauda zhangzhouensis]
MKNKEHIIVNANQAVAHIAYMTNEVFPIYPITPASEMAELVEEWSAHNQKNIFGNVPTTFEMQSEAGVAGAMHGSLQTGSLSSTFTASQGLLLMLPNMHKIAGELTPNVIHVATRAVASHALSVFGDHSDVMSARNTGYAFLASSSVQEAMDFALIAQAATLESCVPFLHFFDGFRTSHEVSKIEKVDIDVIKSMMKEDLVQEHQNRGLNPNNPHISGTSQGPDVFFQSREAVNPYYNNCPWIVQQKMDEFYHLTGRAYKVFEYVGHPEAEQVFISMASSTQTIEETIQVLNANGEKIGLVKARLYRPFSADMLIESIPSTCTSIAVLDRTKEAGSNGEPLYLDVVNSVFQSTKFKTLPKVFGGRYGLASKEFDPSMVKSIVENLKKGTLKSPFTVGIHDDVTNLSLVKSDFIKKFDRVEALFFETKSRQTQQNFDSFLKYVGESDEQFIQGYMEIDYKKSNSKAVSNLRFAQQAINAPYVISDAEFIGFADVTLLKEERNQIRVKQGGTVLVQSELDSTTFWKELPQTTQKTLIEKEAQLFIVDSNEKSIQNTLLQDCFLALTPKFYDLIPNQELLNKIQRVEMSDMAEAKTEIGFDDAFSKTLLGQLLANKGNQVSVSQLPADGVYPTGTSIFNKRKEEGVLPVWDADACIQCGACSMACPSGALRIKMYNKEVKEAAPSQWKDVEAKIGLPKMDLNYLSIQINPDQCTACENCVDACTDNALEMKPREEHHATSKENWNFFEQIPELDRSLINVQDVAQQQLQEPLFKYPMGVDGCAEAPYLKLLSQLYGDRMVVSNATGASSIFGGALPTTPWSKNEKGQGPAWSNSLFEDNAEYGLGFRLSIDQQEEDARTLLQDLADVVGYDLVCEILKAEQSSETEIALQRNRVSQLKAKLKQIHTPEANKLFKISDSLVKSNVWIVGGDGWAYDIGFGGLDHVLASGKNVNILVLDNEVYSNTGGQKSKATPFGARAKFAAKGQLKHKKDLGQLAMQYPDVYVASVAMGADQQHTLSAFLEAEQHDGPSLIIAYCHSPEHGVDMKRPSKYHKAAVNSGQWVLYRNKPNVNGLETNTFILDSKPPSISLEAYLSMEERFDTLMLHNATVLGEAQEFVDKRFQHYQKLASNGIQELVMQYSTQN